MNFGQSITTCLTKYATFSGRASRPEFWWFFLFQVLVSVGVSMLLGETLGALVNLALLLPALAVGARRLHDIGRTGWWQLIGLTGIGFFVLIFWWVQPASGMAD